MQIINPFDATDTLSHTTKKGVVYEMGYDIRENGDMNVSFRHRPTSEIDSGHYGVANRGSRRTDAETPEGGNTAARQTDRAMKFANKPGEKPCLEVQINCLKRDETGAEVFSPEIPGVPEAYMVTFPLRTEARQRVVITGKPITICTPNGWAADVATDDIRAVWADAENARIERKRKRDDKASEMVGGA
jgi:hypothetical protein